MKAAAQWVSFHFSSIILSLWTHL